MTDKITKFIESLPPKIRKQLKSRLKEIRESPHSAKDIKKLKGYKNTYRMRMGSIRVIFEVTEERIKIKNIDYRGNIY